MMNLRWDEARIAENLGDLRRDSHLQLQLGVGGVDRGAVRSPLRTYARLTECEDLHALGMQ